MITRQGNFLDAQNIEYLLVRKVKGKISNFMSYDANRAEPLLHQKLVLISYRRRKPAMRALEHRAA